MFGQGRDVQILLGTLLILNRVDYPGKVPFLQALECCKIPYSKRSNKAVIAAIPIIKPLSFLIFFAFTFFLSFSTPVDPSG